MVFAGVSDEDMSVSHPPHPYLPNPLRRVVLRVIPVDRLPAVLDHRRHGVLHPTSFRS